MNIYVVKYVEVYNNLSIVGKRAFPVSGTNF